MKKFLFLFVFWYFGMYAQETINTDRPGQGESPATLVPGRFQVETGSGTYQAMSSGGGVSEKAWVFTQNLLLKYGVSPLWELRFVGNYTREFGENSYGPWELGTKIRLFHKETSPVIISLLAHLTSDFQNFGTLNKILLSYSFAPKWTFYSYFGYRHTEPNANFGMYMLNFVFQAHPRFAFYAQVYDNSLAKGNTLHFLPEVGGTYLLADNWQLDYSFGDNYAEDSFYGSLGLSFFPKKKHK